MIGAVASLLWPVLALVALLAFRAPLSRLIRSAEDREWTIEVGGQTITVKELSDQQNALIVDLQEQIGALHKTVAELQSAQPALPGPASPTAPDVTPPAPMPATAEPAPSEPDTQPSAPPAEPWKPPHLPGQPEQPEQPAPPQTPPVAAATSGAPVAGGASLDDAVTRPRAYSVLWVDDNPQNNALLIEQMARHGLLVDLAISTQAGLHLLGRRRYGMVISDMVRHENGATVFDAGMRLLRAVRQLDPDIPFVLYCNPHARDLNNDLALAEGANAITSSGATLLEQLRAAGLLDR